MNYTHQLDREEGFTGAFNRAPWVRRFAWLPVRLTRRPYSLVWLKWIERKDYGAFGIRQFVVRLCDSDTHPKDGDDFSAPLVSGAGLKGIAHE